MSETEYEEPTTPDEGVLFMHLDDFLNAKHAETGHVEAVSAFGKHKKARGQWKQTEEQWKADYDEFMNSIPQ